MPTKQELDKMIREYRAHAERYDIHVPTNRQELERVATRYAQDRQDVADFFKNQGLPGPKETEELVEIEITAEYVDDGKNDINIQLESEDIVHLLPTIARDLRDPGTRKQAIDMLHTEFKKSNPYLDSVTIDDEFNVFLKIIPPSAALEASPPHSPKSKPAPAMPPRNPSGPSASIPAPKTASAQPAPALPPRNQPSASKPAPKTATQSGPPMPPRKQPGKEVPATGPAMPPRPAITTAAPSSNPPPALPPRTASTAPASMVKLYRANTKDATLAIEFSSEHEKRIFQHQFNGFAMDYIPNPNDTLFKTDPGSNILFVKPSVNRGPGAYFSLNNELSINLGNVLCRDKFAALLNIKAEHALMPFKGQGENALYFDTKIIAGNKSKADLPPLELDTSQAAPKKKPGK